MTIDEFMALGVVCGALRIADFSVGTFTADYLTDAYSQGIRVCVPERWGPFLRRICCTPRQFRQRQSAFSAGSLAYPQFEFNLVRQYPISEITPNHFLAIDPELIIERAAYGLFYDLFDRDGFEFSRNFGASFEKFVGMLLGSADMAGVLWSHADWQAANPTATIQGKVSDHAYVSNNATILFECKSLRPTVKLITVADESSMSDITNRIAEGLRQLIEHNDAIKSGHWVTAGLPQRDAAAFVLVMYGQLYTVNGALWRVLIKAQLKKLGLEPGPFVVLSISDLDSVISLVERGHSLESIVVKLCNEENSLSDFPELRTDSVSSFSRERASQLLEEITSRSTAEKR
jgi:hypothetical protein